MCCAWAARVWPAVPVSRTLTTRDIVTLFSVCMMPVIVKVEMWLLGYWKDIELRDVVL